MMEMSHEEAMPMTMEMVSTWKHIQEMGNNHVWQINA
jgi:hypothetical protein